MPRKLPAAWDSVHAWSAHAQLGPMLTFTGSREVTLGNMAPLLEQVWLVLLQERGLSYLGNR